MLHLQPLQPVLQATPLLKSRAHSSHPPPSPDSLPITFWGGILNISSR